MCHGSPFQLGLHRYIPLWAAGGSWDAGGGLASSPRSAVGKGFGGVGESVNLADWIQRKREQLQRLRPVDVRNLVPTVKDFSQAVSARRQNVDCPYLAVVTEIARATPEEGRLVEALDMGERVRQADSAS